MTQTKNLVDPKNFLLILSFVGLVFLGIMGFTLYNQNMAARLVDKDTLMLNSQSTGDDITSIEKDANATNFNDIDKELNDIDTELNSSNQF